MIWFTCHLHHVITIQFFRNNRLVLATFREVEENYGLYHPSKDEMKKYGMHKNSKQKYGTKKDEMQKYGMQG